MRAFRFELYRVFHSRSLYISLLIGFTICVLDIVTFFIEDNPAESAYLIQAWIGTDYRFAYNSMFFVLLPVLASLPYGGSLYTDIKSGYDKNICIKVSRLNYVLAKSCSVFISAFISVSMPLGINLLVTAGLYPNYIPERLEWLSIGLLDRHLFTLIYSNQPAVYCILYILIDGLFAGAIALSSLSIARAAKSHFSTVVMPMVIYITSGILLEGDDTGNWSIMAMLNPRQYLTTQLYQLIIAFLVTFTINIVIVLLFSRKRDIL